MEFLKSQGLFRKNVPVFIVLLLIAAVLLNIKFSKMALSESLAQAAPAAAVSKAEPAKPAVPEAKPSPALSPEAVKSALPADAKAETAQTPPAKTDSSSEAIFKGTQNERSYIPKTSLIGYILMVLFSLAIVCLLAMLVLRVVYSKAGLSLKGFSKEKLINVIDRQMLQPNRMIYIVEAAGKYLLIGVSDGNISILTELDKDTVLAKGVNPTGVNQNIGSFPQYFANLLSKKNPEKKP